MYKKNLTHSVHIRLSQEDVDKLDQLLGMDVFKNRTGRATIIRKLLRQILDKKCK